LSTNFDSLLAFLGNSSKTVVMGNRNLTIEEVVSVARHNALVRLTDSHEVLQGVQASCDYISNAVESGAAIYGVTSGFGGMANVVISPFVVTRQRCN
jgi:phenylalanine ammonia-lyase